MSISIIAIQDLLFNWNLGKNEEMFIGKEVNVLYIICIMRNS